MKFNKGDSVIWGYETGGSSIEMRGAFIVRIPPLIDYRPFLPPETPLSHNKSDMPLDEMDRALVEVLQEDGKACYYTPQFNQLHKHDEATTSDNKGKE
ncbi:hypothetical protein BK120_33660 [Paenibacillus sp. FSL A5-0031]|uniref:hypothetical protein n=1 Tax=Paenibacillus sp. FSL A5-0031 TaxID=1920420 RepID=UPI00096DFEE9|nr:hypothetical protein [Paenibacillus sp. FSL A5-0031]OME70104.1 hypothetical protein BK120_33660 [Paenibacillus sp. FSL A5-0031]